MKKVIGSIWIPILGIWMRLVLFQSNFLQSAVITLRHVAGLVAGLAGVCPESDGVARVREETGVGPPGDLQFRIGTIDGLARCW